MLKNITRKKKRKIYLINYLFKEYFFQQVKLAEKKEITPKDLYDKPLMISQHEDKGYSISQWMKRQLQELNIVATYNLIFNASLLVEEGVGYAIGLDKIINTSGNSNLCFRPLVPKLEAGMNLIWKKYQMFTKPTEKFIIALQESLSSDEDTL